MRVARAAMAMFFMSIAATSLAAQQPPQTPAPGQPATPSQTPGQQPPVGQPAPGQPTAGQPTAGATGPAAAPPQPRTFTAPVGLLLNTVRADRVDDFEKALASLQAALASSTNERVRAQAAGWRIFKATEAAPGGAALYVFVLDPTVMGADYSLGRILADGIQDEVKLREIWKLYTGSVTGASLLNLTPFKPPATTETTPAAPVIEKPEK